jgi:uncharacterized protein DUF4349
MKNLLLICSVLSFAVLLACNASDQSSNQKEPANISQLENREPEQNKATVDKNISNRTAGNGSFWTDTTNGSQQQIPATNKTANPDWDKKIIKNANVNIEVKSFKSFGQSVKDKIRKYGGYVSQEQQNQNDYKIEDVITIKVPVDQFDNLVNELTAGEDKISEKKITSEDVTTAVVDTKSRLEAKKEVRLRYLELLKQAKNMEEILNVQHEINSIQEEIEAASGRIEYLSHASALSTINLTYFQILNATAKDPDKISFGTKLWQAFRNGWEWVGDVFIGLISIWPLYLAGFLCWLAYKRFKPARNRNGKVEEVKQN